MGGAGAMIYRGSLDNWGHTWTNNVILGNADSTTVGSDTLGYNGSGVDVFASAAISGDSSFTSNASLNSSVSTAGGGISAEEGSTFSVSGSTFNGNQAEGRWRNLGTERIDTQRLWWHVQRESGRRWRRSHFRRHQHQRDRGQLLIQRQ